MRHRFLIAIAAFVAFPAFPAATHAQAQATPDSKKANEAIYSGTHHQGKVPPHDFSGVWMAPDAFRVMRINEKPDTFLQPWAMAKLEAEPPSMRKDLPAGHAGNATALGKDQDISCSQFNLTDFFTKQKPLEIVHTPQRIFMFFEYAHTFREIWMDGRAVPTDPDPTYFGTSVGHWDGDTLVVDTVGFNDDTVLNGMPHSDAAHLVERYTRPDLDTLQLSLSATDPKAYTKPWTAGPVKLAWHPDWEIVEAFCIQDDNSSFKNSVIDPAWTQTQGAKGAKPASTSGAK